MDRGEAFAEGAGGRIVGDSESVATLQGPGEEPAGGGDESVAGARSVALATSWPPTSIAITASANATDPATRLRNLFDPPSFLMLEDPPVIEQFAQMRAH